VKLDVTELSITEMLASLNRGDITSVDLVCAYFNRIAFYDRSGYCLNSVPVLNVEAIAEARASDEWRRSGRTPRPLEGIPFTVKDSYKVAGLTVASGSPAFADLIATTDAASVELLRAAGAILIGKTNMPPMAAGGMQPGLYGRPVSPYNPDYFTGAYGSGSSSGSAVCATASLSAFAMAEETLSSGRSPAANSGLVAYTPSRGLISIRGNWPLSPACDVVVPYTRSLEDMFLLLDVLVAEDADVTGDFWRSQDVVAIPGPAQVRPETFTHPRPDSLQGVRIGVPRMFLGDDPLKSNPVTIRASVRALWDVAAADLTRLGAEVVPVDFPAVTHYETDRPDSVGLTERGLVNPVWAQAENDVVLAIAWEEFLQTNGWEGLDTLTAVDGDRVFPNPPDNVYAAAGVVFDYARVVELAKQGLPAMHEVEGYAETLAGLEEARRILLEDWMDGLGLDALAFPTNGDVARSDVDTNPVSMDHAVRNGVAFSNGNRAIRHLGVPTVTVPMGRLADVGMPAGITFAGRAYSDDRLLDLAHAYEKATMRRPKPTRTAGLPSSEIALAPGGEEFVPAFDIDVDLSTANEGWVLDVHITAGHDVGPLDGVAVEAWVDGLAGAVATTAKGHGAIFTISNHRPRVEPEALLVVKITKPGQVPAAAIRKVPLAK
jgi:amidase